jgi:hypothetical protein
MSPSPPDVQAVIPGLLLHQFLPRITDRISDRSDTAEHLEPRLQLFPKSLTVARFFLHTSTFDGLLRIAVLG